MRSALWFWLLLWPLSACQQNSSPPEPVSSAPIPGLPHQLPEAWLMAHIDVETTGLIPGHHEMIDIGVVYTNLQGQILDSLFLRIQPKHPLRMDSGAYRVNNFNPQLWEELGALPTAEAVDSLREFHREVADRQPVLLVAYNSYFDAAFLDHLFREAGASWRELYYYYILDLPSMAWSLGFRDLSGREFMERYQIKDEPHVAALHTGITGAMKNVRIYQALVKHHQMAATPDRGSQDTP